MSVSVKARREGATWLINREDHSKIDMSPDLLGDKMTCSNRILIGMSSWVVVKYSLKNLSTGLGFINCYEKCSDYTTW